MRTYTCAELVYTNLDIDLNEKLGNFEGYDSDDEINEVGDLNLLTRHVTSRIANILLGVIGVVTSVVDGAFGTIAAVFSLMGSFVSLAGFEAFENISEYSEEHLESLTLMFSRIFNNAIHVIFPGAKIECDNDKKHHFENDTHLLGIYTHKAYLMKEYGVHLATNSDSFLMRHLGSRVVILTGLGVCIITRLFDATIGSAAALLSLVNFGTSVKLNTYAYQGLQVAGILMDIHHFAFRIINPSYYLNANLQVERNRQSRQL
jgi:hypothetical protein